MDLDHIVSGSISTPLALVALKQFIPTKLLSKPNLLEPYKRVAKRDWEGLKPKVSLILLRMCLRIFLMMIYK